jgi:hypothetical protein
MNVRIERDRLLKEALGDRIAQVQPTRTWYEYMTGTIPKPAPISAQDAAAKPFMKELFQAMLDNTDPPAVFKPDDVAQMLSDAQLRECGYDKWEDALPAMYEVAFEMRAFGDCELLRKGKVIGTDVGIEDLDGPIRVRRKADDDEDW